MYFFLWFYIFLLRSWPEDSYSLYGFFFYFQKLIFVPVIHVKTLEHVKTSVHITHAPVLLDFKVSTVRQVKKLDEQTTNIETKLL